MRVTPSKTGINTRSENGACIAANEPVGANLEIRASTGSRMAPPSHASNELMATKAATAAIKATAISHLHFQLQNAPDGNHAHDLQHSRNAQQDAAELVFEKDFPDPGRQGEEEEEEDDGIER